MTRVSDVPEAAEVFFGLPDVYVRMHDHIGHFFRGAEERYTVLIPFIAAGLRAGDYCLCLTENPEISELAERLDEAGIDVDRALESGQLATTVGAPDAQAMAARFEQATDAALEAGWPVIRIGGDMTWALGQMPTAEHLLEWEALYDSHVGHQANFVALCQYDHTRFSANAVVYALETHPLCIIGGIVQQNPFYRDAEEVLAELRAGGSFKAT